MKIAFKHYRVPSSPLVPINGKPKPSHLVHYVKGEGFKPENRVQRLNLVEARVLARVNWERDLWFSGEFNGKPYETGRSDNPSEIGKIPPHPRGGKTICYIINGDEVIASDEVLCVFKDAFCYRIGRQITFGRAERELFLTASSEIVEQYTQEAISSDQAWFWTDRWQRLEREAQSDIDAGRISHSDNIADTIDKLESTE